LDSNSGGALLAVVHHLVISNFGRVRPLNRKPLAIGRKLIVIDTGVWLRDEGELLGVAAFSISQKNVLTITVAQRLTIFGVLDGSKPSAAVEKGP
jgi:hypothetical protein